jgi:hypothetical protein
MSEVKPVPPVSVIVLADLVRNAVLPAPRSSARVEWMRMPSMFPGKTSIAPASERVGS